MRRIRQKPADMPGNPVNMTSGLFNLPTMPDAKGLDLRVYVSNFGKKAECACITVNSPEGYGKDVLTRTRLLVPSMGTAMHRLDVRGCAGRVVEVELSISSGLAKPSLAVVACTGDGPDKTERTVFFLPPTAFPRI